MSERATPPVPKNPAVAKANRLSRRGFLGSVLAAGAVIVVKPDRADRVDPSRFPRKRGTLWIGHY